MDEVCNTPKLLLVGKYGEKITNAIQTNAIAMRMSFIIQILLTIVKKNSEFVEETLRKL